MIGAKNSMSMSLCQAAALALVGWHLMLPPDRGGKDGQVILNPNAPIREWFLAGSFDTADACKQGQAEGFGHWSDAASKHAGTKQGDKDNAMVAWYNFGRCIATDDPRLREK